jgi:hypothetical protein
VRGRATIVDGPAAEAGNAALRRRYGWQHNVVPLLRLPGVKNVHQTLPLREKLRRATTNDLWPDSAIVEVALDCGCAAEATATPGDGA